MIEPKQQFLDAYDQEYATTMKVLRAYPADRSDLRPHAKSKSARELAWVFALERGLGTMVLNGALTPEALAQPMPEPPESWDELLAGVEKAHADFGALVRGLDEEELGQGVPFFTGPGTIGEVPRLRVAWFLLCDEIHHRGQFSVYLRMADGKVPSIYGPSLDEPWM